MNDKFELPPRRRLPDEIRQRMRTRVWEGLGEPDQRPRWTVTVRGRAPIAVAAAVVVLVAGGVTLLQSVQGGGGQPTAGGQATTTRPSQQLGPLLVPGVAQSAVDKCQAVAFAQTTPGDYAEPDRWRPRFSVSLPGREVAVFDAAGPVFCELTRTTVTVSPAVAAPQVLDVSAPASAARVTSLFQTANHTLAGTVDSQVTGLELGLANADGSNGVLGRAALMDGVFVANLPLSERGAAQGGRLLLSATTPTGTLTGSGPVPDGRVWQGTTVDVWPSGDSDPTSRRNQLDRCLDRALVNGLPGTDAEGWQPGARVGSAADQEGVLVAHRDDGQLVACALADQHGAELQLATRIFAPDRTANPDVPVTAVDLSWRFLTVWGAVGPRVARVELVGENTTATGEVVDGTFAVQLAGVTDAAGWETRNVLRAFDAAGNLLYEGTPVIRR
ncbi:hypothetical protein [Goodfellowiella coeruleoviolacea]|uniref:Uncharacterized protein n=1 Tax=Goodfellowiella coeruleoviolacea TaxID=334858 RepID=A0AAE3GL18_9PSEU|nr:hypothetical protein [Goodfellowiella coeruleoviolacea]MCP2170207.1 hypothetical protein [Goodfellowiella coeruleoviolacea]